MYAAAVDDDDGDNVSQPLIKLEGTEETEENVVILLAVIGRPRFLSGIFMLILKEERNVSHTNTSLRRNMAISMI